MKHPDPDVKYWEYDVYHPHEDPNLLIREDDAMNIEITETKKHRGYQLKWDDPSEKFEILRDGVVIAVTKSRMFYDDLIGYTKGDRVPSYHVRRCEP